MPTDYGPVVRAQAEALLANPTAKLVADLIVEAAGILGVDREDVASRLRQAGFSDRAVDNLLTALIVAGRLEERRVLRVPEVDRGGASSMLVRAQRARRRAAAALSALRRHVHRARPWRRTGARRVLSVRVGLGAGCL